MTSPSATWSGNPNDWAPGDTITEALMDDISSRLMWIKSPPLTVASIATTTTTSTSFVAVTGGSVSVTSVGGRILIGVNVAIYNGTGGASIYMDLAVDGTRLGDSSFGMGFYTSSTTNYGGFFTPTWLTAAQTAGSHTYALYWKVTSGTATLQVGGQIWAMEVP